MPLLPPESLDLTHGEALHADAAQTFLHLIELERLDNGLDFFHAASFLGDSEKFFMLDRRRCKGTRSPSPNPRPRIQARGRPSRQPHAIATARRRLQRIRGFSVLRQIQ